MCFKSYIKFLLFYAKLLTMVSNKLSIFTFTNFGYIHYTKNLLNSIKHNGVDLDLKVYTLDKNSYDEIKKIHENTVYFKDENFNVSNFVRQDEYIFAEIMYKKLEIIYKELLQNDYVLYIDGDVVIKQDITDYLLNHINENDILFQNDMNPDKPKKEYLCAGFMFIKSNKKTLKYFNIENISKKSIYKGNHDQGYLNKIKRRFKYEKLPLDDFPNGIHFYNNFERLTPKIIHFNYIKGELKQEKMRKHSEWYV